MDKDPVMNPKLVSLLEGVYWGYLKNLLKRVYCPECDKTGSPTIGLSPTILTEIHSGREYIYAVCPVCNNHYNLGDMGVLMSLQRHSHNGQRKPLVDFRNIKYSERYNLK